MVSAVVRPDPLPCGPRCCTRCCTSPLHPGVSARCSHHARSGPPDPTAAGSARRCDDARRHVPGVHDADRADPGTRAIGQRDRTRVGGRQGHARPGPLLLGQRRQDVERASRVPTRAASRCRSPLTSWCPVDQERRRGRGGEHRWNGSGGAERRCSRRRLRPARRAGELTLPCAGTRPTEVSRSAGDGEGGAAVEVDGEHARQAQQPRLQQLGAVGVGHGVDAQAPAPGASLLGLEAGE